MIFNTGLTHLDSEASNCHIDMSYAALIYKPPNYIQSCMSEESVKLVTETCLQFRLNYNAN